MIDYAEIKQGDNVEKLPDQCEPTADWRKAVAGLIASDPQGTLVIGPLIESQAAEIADLQAQLAEAEARGFAQGIEARGAPIRMTYRNWRGEVGAREILPLKIWWGHTDWHPNEGWMLSGYDLAKAAHRDFALADCQFATLAPPADVQPDPVREAAMHLAGLAAAEAAKAIRKFPQPNYVISKVADEAGEVVKAAIHCAEGRGSAEAVRGEIVQAMAMLIRLYVEGDGVHSIAALAGDQQ